MEGAMRIRILVGGMPRMLRDIVEDVVAAQPDMELLAGGDASDLVTTIKAKQPDLVVVAEQWAGLNLPHQQLLVDNRRLRVLVVTAGGRDARLLELRQVPVIDVSSQRLVDAIREALALEGSPRTD